MERFIFRCSGSFQPGDCILHFGLRSPGALFTARLQSKSNDRAKVASAHLRNVARMNMKTICIARKIYYSVRHPTISDKIDPDLHIHVIRTYFYAEAQRHGVHYHIVLICQQQPMACSMFNLVLSASFLFFTPYILHVFVGRCYHYDIMSYVVALPLCAPPALTRFKTSTTTQKQKQIAVRCYGYSDSINGSTAQNLTAANHRQYRRPNGCTNGSTDWCTILRTYTRFLGLFVRTKKKEKNKIRQN